MHRKSWKNYVNDHITFNEFCEAWIDVFKYPLDECKINSISEDSISLITPTGSIFHGGFGNYTENPVLKNNKDEYYCGCGCTWGVDSNGERFYYLNKATGLPYDDSAISHEIIRRFLNQGNLKGVHVLKNIDRARKIGKIKININLNING